MKFVSVAEMVAIEREANEAGLSYEMMMENAGRGMAEVLLEEYGYLEGEGVLGLVGSGNNGGDTLIALDFLAREGWKTSAYIIRPREPGDPLTKRLMESGGAITQAIDDRDLTQLALLLESHGLVLDGILGTGFQLPIKLDLAKILRAIHATLNALKNPPVIVAVDCPSGVNCDSGESSPECLPAEMTVTMAAYKQGLFKFPAYQLVGEIRLVNIGLPGQGEALQSWNKVQTFVPDRDWIRDCLPARPQDAHKGSFGTAVIVAGSINYTGAAWLAGQAAYRIGTGLVTLAVPRSLHAVLAGQFPEATWLPLPEVDGVIASQAVEKLKHELGRATSILLGPGLGLSPETGKFVASLFDHAALPPMVIDADGLKLLKQKMGWVSALPRQCVLTPHPGEMSVLTEIPTNEIQSRRLEIARRFSQEWDRVVVLKGAFTIVASPSGEAAVIPVATPALARAGTGDVLAGFITGLLAQGVPTFQAAVAGAWMHAYAGIYAAQEHGNTASVLAGDLLDAVIQVLGELN